MFRSHGSYSNADRLARRDKALTACQIVKMRLLCIGRELEAHPIDGETLSPETRSRVRDALRNHQIRCEGVIDAALL
jgi:hypothetical protein